MLGGIRTENGRIDLKRAGLFGIVTLARVLAIRHRLLERSTPARLAAAKALGRSEDDLTALTAAQADFLDLILSQQLVDIANGLPPSNKVEVKRLSRERRARLRASLGVPSAVSKILVVKREAIPNRTTMIIVKEELGY